MKRIAIAIIGLALASGCHESYGPDVRVDWPARPTAIANVPRPQGAGLLQVITGYTPPVYSHAALRLQTTDGQVIFWDPGGDYALRTPKGRIEDRIVHPPEVAEYIRWRLDVVGDRGGEVFEWDLTPEHAAQLALLLVNGATTEQPKEKFNSNEIGGRCALSISSFLRRYCPQQVKMTRNWFYPYDLAQAMYKENPDRIIVYHKKKPVVVYYRPEDDQQPQPTQAMIDGQ